MVSTGWIERGEDRVGMDSSDVPYSVDQCKRSVLSLPRRHPPHLPEYSLFPISTLPLSADPCFSPTRCANFSDRFGYRGEGRRVGEKSVSRAKTPLLVLSPFDPLERVRGWYVHGKKKERESNLFYRREDHPPG